MISGNRRIPLVYNSSKKTPGYAYNAMLSRPIRIGCLSCPPPPLNLGEYDWMLIDNTNEVWISDADFSNLRTTGKTIPIGTNYWQNGYYHKCLWTGKYWLFGNYITKKILTADTNLQSWSEVDGVTINSMYDMTTNGGNTTVIATNGSNSYMSNDNGKTWVNKGVILNNDNFCKTYYDNNLWIVFSARSLLTSSDNGTTFTQRISPPNQMLAICKTPTEYTVVGRNDVVTSVDGLTWTTSTMGTGVSNNLLGEILYNGNYFVGVGQRFDGPVWATTTTSNWTKWTSTDGTSLSGFDYDYNRLHYNGTIYSYRNPDDNVLYKSSDGKLWSKFAHPISGRHFIDSYPKLQDKNLNFK